MKCSICNLEFLNKLSLSKHLQQKHNFSKEEIFTYYQKIINNTRSNDSDNFIQCKICGNYYKSLQFHISSKHKIKTEEYLKQYGGLLFSSACLESNSKGTKRKFTNMSTEERHIYGQRIANIRKQRETNRGGRKPGFKHTKEEKQRHSAWCIQNNSQKFFKDKKHIREFYLSDKIPLGFKSRSSWEIQAALIFDMYNKIDTYEYEKLKIPYKDHFLISDFLLNFSNSKKCLVEIKPKCIVNIKKDKILEHECFCLENNIQYLILTELFFADCWKNKSLNYEKVSKLFRLLDLVFNGEMYVDKIIKRGFENTLQFIETMYSKW